MNEQVYLVNLINWFLEICVDPWTSSMKASEKKLNYSRNGRTDSDLTKRTFWNRRFLKEVALLIHKSTGMKYSNSCERGSFMLQILNCFEFVFRTLESRDVISLRKWSALWMETKKKKNRLSLNTFFCQCIQKPHFCFEWKN